jgi:hypothetical protein
VLELVDGGRCSSSTRDSGYFYLLYRRG